MKFSIIIPNYNGEKLLAENLPKVIKTCEKRNKKDWEIIVVDDCSSDNSIFFLKDNYSQVKIVINKKNKGFAFSCNRGVKMARGEIVILLNSDVVPEQNFIKPLLPYFAKKDTFSVSCLEKVKQRNIISLHGRGKGILSKGFFLHQKYPEYKQAGYSLWAVGGASAFNKKIWLEIGGYDLIFSPFYWEDVDLGFCGWLKGYKTYFEPKSIVWHNHEEGTIKTYYQQSFIESINYKNQFLFYWKYFLQGKYLFWHLFWLPYHFITSLLNKKWSFFKGFILALKSFKYLKRTKPDITAIDISEIFKPK